MKKPTTQGAVTVILAVSLALTSACYYHEVETRHPPTTVATYAPPAMVVQNDSAAPVQTPQQPQIAAQPQEQVEQQVVIAAPAPVQTPETMPELSPEIAEVVKLAQSQVGDDVLLNYIASSQHAFNPSADELIFLADIGVSNDVINALIMKSPAPEQLQAVIESAQTEPPAAQQQVAAHSGAPAAGTPNVVIETPHAAAQQEQVVQEAPVQVVQETVVVQQPVQQQTVVYEVAEPVTYFQPVLAPYGTWVEIAPYGLCWQPTVAVVDTGWRPYGNRGRWLHTGQGWYWQSDYSWGWAPFHYGRWHRHTSYGWVWTPGSTWGPAWVSWRRSNAYCGWAPLPPVARYRSGFGYSYYNTRVGTHFEWGLSSFDYCYVPLRHFHTHHPHHHFLPRHSVRSVHRGTRVINDHHRDRSGRVVNRGVPKDEIARLTRKEIRRVRIADRPTGKRSVIQPDRVIRQGNDYAIYRGGPGSSIGRGSNKKTSASATATDQGRSEVLRSPRASSSLSASTRTAIKPSGGGRISKTDSDGKRPTPASADQGRPSSRRFSTGTPSAQPAASRGELSRTPPKPVTSTPTNPRASVGGLRPSKPVTSSPTNPRATVGGLKPSTPVSSTPKNPRASVGGLTPSKPIASRPSNPAQPNKNLSAPKPITSVPRRPASPAPVSITRKPATPSWQPYGSSSSVKPSVRSTPSRKPTPSPNAPTSSRSVVGRGNSSASKSSSLGAKPITGFQNPRSAIFRRNSSSPTASQKQSLSPSPSSRTVIRKPANRPGSSVGASSRITTRPSISRPAPSPSRPTKQYTPQAPTRPAPAPRTITPRPAPSRPTISRPTPSRPTFKRPAPRPAAPQRATAPQRRSKPAPSSRPSPNRK